MLDESIDSNESAEGSVNTNEPISSEETRDFQIPEMYRDRPYLKDVKSNEDLFKKLDGAQSLIGKKVLFPTEESSEEDIRKFNLAAGMPEKAEDYVFEKVGEAERIPEFDSKVKEIFHKHGISAKAAAGIAKDYETLIGELERNNAEQTDAQFEELSRKTFGERQEQVLASAKQLLEENMPKEFAETFSKLPNKELVMFAGVLDNLREKYINEDRLTPPNGGFKGEDRKGLQNRLHNLIDERDKAGAFASNYKELSDEISNVAKRIAQLDE